MSNSTQAPVATSEMLVYTGEEYGVDPVFELYRGPMVLNVVLPDGNIVTANGDGRVFLDTRSGSSVRWTFACQEFAFGPALGFTGDFSVTIPEINGIEWTAPVNVTTLAHLLPSSRLQAGGLFRDMVPPDLVYHQKYGKPESVGEVVFLVSNLADFWGTAIYRADDSGRRDWMGRLHFPFGPWEVTLDSLPNAGDLLREAKAVKGSCVTHIGRLRKKDGKLFSVGKTGKTGMVNAEKALEALYLYLCFINGQRCSILLPTGRRRSNVVYWEKWVAYRGDRAQDVYRWFPDRMPTMEGFSSADLFYRCWEKPANRDWLSRAVTLYVVANTNPSGIDLALIISQSALELLCWAAMMEVNQLMSEGSFENLSAADKLRTLLFWLNVPPAIPPRLTNLKRAFRDADGPKATSDLRNWLVHPTRKNRQASDKAGDDPVVDAWYLNMWYVELTLLRLIGYRGVYENRLKMPYERTMEQVPWAANP